MRIATVILIIGPIYVLAAIALLVWLYDTDAFSELRHAFSRCVACSHRPTLLRLQLFSLIEGPRLRGLRVRT